MGQLLSTIDNFRMTRGFSLRSNFIKDNTNPPALNNNTNKYYITFNLLTLSKTIVTYL